MIPKDAKLRDDNVLAFGEQTGHLHRATAKTAKVYDLPNGGMVLDAPRGTEVVHQEHGVVSVPPGQYDRLLVQEFDPFAEEIRSVID